TRRPLEHPYVCFHRVQTLAVKRRPPWVRSSKRRRDWLAAARRTRRRVGTDGSTSSPIGSARRLAPITIRPALLGVRVGFDPARWRRFATIRFVATGARSPARSDPRVQRPLQTRTTRRNQTPAMSFYPTCTVSKAGDDHGPSPSLLRR